MSDTTSPRSLRTARRGRLLARQSGYLIVEVIDPVSTVPGEERWSYGAFDFDYETERRTIPLVRDDGRTAAFTLPEFVSEPADIAAVARIVIDACERWENRQGVGS